MRQHGGVFGRNPTFNDVTVDGVLTVDQIIEKTGASGITLDGVTLKDGNVIVASGNGIDFSATGGATGIASSILDDYEEGTWTPQVVSYDGAITINRATYTKTGNIVHAFFSITFDGTADGSQVNILVSSLPFAITNDGSFCAFVADASPTGAGNKPVLLRREFATAIYATDASLNAVSYATMGTGNLTGLFVYQRT